jgi:hypothetical protein
MLRERPLLKLLRKTRSSRLSLPSFQEKRRAGGQPWPEGKAIRLIFDQPQRLKQISLAFEEKETERTQEFVLRWTFYGVTSFREIVRQQWSFGSPETVRGRGMSSGTFQRHRT